jgi:uroporphyrinogen-III synthase
MSIHQPPLLGKRIVVTRAAEKANSLCDLLRKEGAEPIELPLISFQPLLNVEDAQPTTRRLSDFDWIVFTSSKAIEFFFGLMDGREIPGSVRLACVGNKTAATLKSFGQAADFVPTTFSGENLANEMEINAGDRFLYPCAQQTASDLATVFELRGAVVTVWPIYETIPVVPAAGALDNLNSGFDAITFASPSAVDSYCDGIGKQSPPSQHCLIACIGPMTARRARERGLTVDVVPDTSDVSCLVSALFHRFRLQVARDAS